LYLSLICIWSCSVPYWPGLAVITAGP
jgi:hypothetical protein